MSKDIKAKEIKHQGAVFGAVGDGAGLAWPSDAASLRRADLQIKVTQEQIASASAWLKGHLANTILSIGASSYDPGTIERLGADIRALDRIEAALGSVPSTPRAFRTDEDIRKDAQAAMLEHSREQERKEKARD